MVHFSIRKWCTFGLDYTLMAENMESVNRTPVIASKIQAIEDSIAAKELAKAKTLLEDLEQETAPTQPDLVRLRAIINRLAIIGR